MNTRSALLVVCALVVGFAGCSQAGNPDTGPDADTDADTDADGDADTDADADSDSDADTDADGDTDTGVDTETITDTDVLACLDEYDWPCECQGDCDDGFGWVVLYPEEAGEFYPGAYPSEELLAAGVGWHYCSVCTECDEWRRVKPAGDWIDVGLLDFCTFITDWDAECGGCLVTVSGGGG